MASQPEPAQQAATQPVSQADSPEVRASSGDLYFCFLLRCSLIYFSEFLDSSSSSSSSSSAAAAPHTRCHCGMWLQLVIEVLVSVVVVRAATARQLFPLTPLLCPSKHGKRCAASRHMLVSCVRDFLLALVFWAVVHTRCRHAGTSVSTADEEGGGGAAADRGIIIFLIERSWDPSVPYGEVRDPPPAPCLFAFALLADCPFTTARIMESIQLLSRLLRIDGWCCLQCWVALVW